MVYICLVLILVELVMSKHLSWRILHSLWSDTSFLTRIYFTGTWSLLILINLKVWSTSSSWWMHRILSLSTTHYSSVDGPNVTMTLLLLLRSWPRSIVRRIWIVDSTGSFLLAVAHLILTWMVRTLIIFAISSGLSVAATHVHVLLLL